MSVAEDEEIREPEFFGIPMKHIEHDYIIPANQVVSFPNNLGLAGYVYTRNAVCLINDFAKQVASSIQPPTALVPAIKQHLLTRTGYLMLAGRLASGVTYSSKIDNFIEFKGFNNLLISSLEDEMFLGYPEAVGVI